TVEFDEIVKRPPVASIVPASSRVARKRWPPCGVTDQVPFQVAPLRTMSARHSPASGAPSVEAPGRARFQTVVPSESVTRTESGPRNWYVPWLLPFGEAVLHRPPPARTVPTSSATA